MTPKALVDALEWRYATKKFDVSRPLEGDVWDALKKAMVLSPSSLGLQLWRFVEVADPALRERLREVSWGQAQVTDCSRFVVFTVRRDYTAVDMERHLTRLCAVRGVSRESMNAYAERIAGMLGAFSPTELSAWMGHQPYIALGMTMMAAAVLGVDACPMEGLEPAAYDRILGLEGTPYRTLCALALGYRGDDSYAGQRKARFPEDEVFVTL